MNLGTLAGFLSLGLELWAAHTTGDQAKIARTLSTLRMMARKLDSLYTEEAGQPMDWSKIREHEHLT